MPQAVDYVLESFAQYAPADQLLLVMEGTYISGQTLGSEGVGRAAAAAADALLDAAVDAAP